MIARIRSTRQSAAKPYQPSPKNQIIQQKIELVAGWLKDNWGISLYGLRKEVQKRQYATNPDGSFKFRGGMLVNNLTSPTVTNPSITVIDSLVNVVNAYKSLQK